MEVKINIEKELNKLFATFNEKERLKRQKIAK